MIRPQEPTLSAATNADSSAREEVSSTMETDDAPRIQKRPRRTHARRSCQMCQQRKARCELPDLDVPSSPLPLPDHQSCHRCRTLQISCIVDDSNKKRSKKSNPTAQAPSSSDSRTRSNTVDRRPLNRSSTSTTLSTLGERISISGASNDGYHDSALPSGVATASVESNSFAGGREQGDQIVYPSVPRIVSRTPDSSSDEASSPPPAESSTSTRPHLHSFKTYIKTQDRVPSEHGVDVDSWERYSTRSRPLTLLTELVPRQNGFASKIFRLISARATIETDVREIISDQKSKQLSDWCEDNLTIWLPHIPNAYQIRQEALQGKQTLSTQLLEQILYLVALQHIRDPQDDILRFSLARFVIRDLARLMLTSPRASKAVEALELLSIFPVDVAVLPGPSRNRVRTDALINASERFARSIRLDRVALTSAAPYSFFASSSSLDEFETKRMAMEWASVKVWHTCFTIGDDELYESVDPHFFPDDWSRSLMMTLDSEEPEASKASSISQACDLFEQKRWSLSRRIGSIGLAMRCIAFRRVLEAFHAIRSIPVELPEHERLDSISTMLDDWRRDFDYINQERTQRLGESEEDTTLLQTWLTVEFTAGYLLILGTGILRALGVDKKENVPSDQLASLIRGERASAAMQHFLGKYGEYRILAAEKVLTSLSTIRQNSFSTATDTKGVPRNTGGAETSKSGGDANHINGRRAWVIEGRSRLVAPLTNICGYALEAAFSAVEMHATVFKFWKTPPKRSDSWQMVFSNVIEALRSLDPDGSIQGGSITATCAFILQGMLEIIVCWTDCSRKKVNQKTAWNSTPTLQQGEMNMGGFAASQASQTSEGVSMQTGQDLNRFTDNLEGELVRTNNLDAMAAFGHDQSMEEAARESNAASAGNGGPGSEVATVLNAPSLTASLFEAGQGQIASGRSDDRMQQYMPDRIEALAAAAPTGTTMHAQANGEYAGMHMQSNRNPPLMATNHGISRESGGPAPMHHGLHASGAPPPPSHPQNDENRGGDGNQIAGYDSIDFILNDVLGSTEWSGILQDIWRTDI